MGCLLVFIAMLLPRLALALIFLFTRWFSAVFEVWVWAVLGFLFMPYTTLVYMGMALNVGQWTLGWILLMVVAIVADISHWGGGVHSRRTVVVKRRH